MGEGRAGNPLKVGFAVIVEDAVKNLA